MPNHAQLDTWKSHTLETLIAAANRSDETPVVKWFDECETKSLKKLGECPKEMMRLDRKFGEALNKILSGRLGSSIQLKKRNVRKATGAILRGRQVYKLMLDSFKTSDAQDNFFGVLDLATLQWRGDEVGQMEQFLQDWERLESGLTSDLKEKERIEVVLLQMQRSQKLQLKVDAFADLKPKNKKRRLQTLLDIIQRHITKERYKENREKKRAAIVPKGSTKDGNKNNALIATDGSGKPAPKAKATAKKRKPGRGICTSWLHGECKNQEQCAYDHPDRYKGAMLKSSPPGGGKGSGGGKGGGKSHDKRHGRSDRSQSSNRSNKSNPRQSRSPSPAARKSKDCWFHQRGLCTLGNNCTWNHKGVKPNPDLATPQEREKAKGKGKGKGNHKSRSPSPGKAMIASKTDKDKEKKSAEAKDAKKAKRKEKRASSRAAKKAAKDEGK